MSLTEYKKRKRAMKIADAINNINGVPVSKFAKELSENWINGTVSDSQMIEKLIEVHKQ